MRALSALVTTVVLVGLGVLAAVPARASAAAPAVPAAAAGSGGAFVPLVPYRLVDTRVGRGGPDVRRFTPMQSESIPVTGVGGVPNSGVGAVVVTLTVVAPTGSGYLTAFADGAARPATSTLNFRPGQTVPNLAVVSVGTDGRIRISNISGGSLELVVDLSGYFTGGASTGPGMYSATTPVRVLDTRTGARPAPFGPLGSRSVVVAGRGAVPVTGVAAVVVNLTVTAPTASGYLTAYATGADEPLASNLNYRPGETRANLAVLPVGSGGQITVGNTSAGSVHVVVDVVGWLRSGPAADGGFASLTPARIADTRRTGAALAAGASMSVQVTGVAGVPAAPVGAVAVNLTATRSTAGGHLTAHAAGNDEPGVSNLNFGPAETDAVFAVVAVGQDGKITLTNHSAGPVQVVVDVFGSFRSPGPSLPLTAEQAPLPADAGPSGDATLTSLSCSGQTCVAVGSYTDRSGRKAGLIETSVPGNWVARSAPLPAGVPSGRTTLESVSCGSPTWCVAVGSAATDADDTAPLVETFDGTAWSTVASRTLRLHPGVPLYGGLDVVSCSGADTCAAAGSYQENLPEYPTVLVETFSSEQWSAAEIPESSSQVFVDDVQCYAPGSCVATGRWSEDESFGWGGFVATLAAGRWTTADLSIPDSYSGAALTGVSCLPSGWCAGVGDAEIEEDTIDTLVGVREKGTWSYHVGPELVDPWDGGSISAPLTCLPSLCLAFGQVDLWTGPSRSVATTYIGGRWSQVEITVPGAAVSRDASFPHWTRPVCRSSAFCVAAGSHVDQAHLRQGVVVVRTASGYTTSPAALGPDPAADPDVEFTGTACRTGSCLMAGSYASTAGRRPLIETLSPAG